MNRIWLATDLSATAELPWAHALKLCATAERDLRVLHLSNEPSPAWSELPSVRDLLIRWGYLPEGATTEQYHQLGFRVRPRAFQANHPVGLLGAMADVHDPDLLIMGTHRPTAGRRLIEGSVAEAVARQAPRATLIVPDGCRPFVDPTYGTCTLRRVLIPCGDRSAQRAVDVADSLVSAFEPGPVEFLYLHVGEVSGIPQLSLPQREHLTHRTINIHDGPVVGRVVERSVAENVDLIAMATAGHDSWQDALFGSRTERVLRDTPCPLLMVPSPAV